MASTPIAFHGTRTESEHVGQEEQENMLTRMRKRMLLWQNQKGQRIVSTLQSWTDGRRLRVAAIEKAEFEEKQRLEAADQKKLQDAIDSLRSNEPLSGTPLRDYFQWKARILKGMKESIGMCEKCKRTDFPLTVDHIIPIFVLRDMGFNPELMRDVRNFRLLCKMCNSLKSNHLDFTDVRTKPLMLEYLATVPGVSTFPAELERDASGSPYPKFLPAWAHKQYDRIHS